MGAPIYHPLAEMNSAKARFCSAKPLYARPAVSYTHLHLMLVGFDELHIRAGSPIQNGCKVHLEPPVVGGKAPRGQIVRPLPRHVNVEGHLPQLCLLYTSGLFLHGISPIL